MTEFPEQVNILGRTFKVRYVKTYNDVDIDRKDGLTGQCAFDRQTISILAGGRPVDAVFQTLMHEVLHAVLAICNANVPEDRHEMVSHALADTLVRNGFIEVDKLRTPRMGKEADA